MAYSAEVRKQLTADSRTIIARYPQARSALLPMLHLVQSHDGYVSPDGIVFCAELLGLQAAEVSAVATFYTQYKRRPNGTYTVGVCTNTLCAIMGGDEIFDSVSEHLGVGHDETTPDGAITLEKLECNAACDYAPVVMVNWEFFDNQTPASTRKLCDDLTAGVEVAPSRGAAKVCTFKEVSRVLAGFLDGRADEGVGAGEPSLAGVRLSRANGWTAPQMRPARAETLTPSRPRDPAPSATPEPTAGSAQAPSHPAQADAPDHPAAAPTSQVQAARSAEPVADDKPKEA